VLIYTDTHSVQAAVFNYLRNEWRVLDPAIKADFAELAKLGRGEGQPPCPVERQSLGYGLSTLGENRRNHDETTITPHSKKYFIITFVSAESRSDCRAEFQGSTRRVPAEAAAVG
jgi:hypothetical protein